MTTHYPDNDTVDVASSLQWERVPASSAHSGNRAASQPDNDHIRVDSEEVVTCRTKDCKRPVWPGKDYCGRTCRDHGCHEKKKEHQARGTMDRYLRDEQAGFETAVCKEIAHLRRSEKEQRKVIKEMIEWHQQLQASAKFGQTEESGMKEHLPPPTYIESTGRKTSPPKQKIGDK